MAKSVCFVIMKVCPACRDVVGLSLWPNQDWVSWFASLEKKILLESLK